MASDTAIPVQSAPLAPPKGQAMRAFWIVFRNEFRYLLLTVRTLAPMAIYAGFAALALYGYVRLGKAIQGDATAEQVEEVTTKAVGEVLSRTGWGTTGDAAEIARDQVPLVIVFFFALSSIFLPLLVALVSFDQFSELSTRGARFVLLRVRRGTYMAGKAVAAAGAVAAFLAVMWAVVVGVAIYRGSSAPIAMKEGLRAWALMSILSLPYLSITAMISSFVRPVLAFVLTLGTWISLGIGAVIVDSFIPWILNGRGWTDAADAERRLLALFPWHHAVKLISRDGATLASGVGSLILLAAIGYTLTFFVVRGRDV